MVKLEDNAPVIELLRGSLYGKGKVSYTLASLDDLADNFINRAKNAEDAARTTRLRKLSALLFREARTWREAADMARHCRVMEGMKDAKD